MKKAKPESKIFPQLAIPVASMGAGIHRPFHPCRYEDLSLDEKMIYRRFKIFADNMVFMDYPRPQIVSFILSMKKGAFYSE